MFIERPSAPRSAAAGPPIRAFSARCCVAKTARTATSTFLGGLQVELEDLLGVKVDLVTPLERFWPRLRRYEGALLEQMLEAAERATNFVAGMEKVEFPADVRTRQAVAMSLIDIGEMASRIERNHPTFQAAHSDPPWANMQGIRNRIAHGHFELDFDVVWETVLTDLPELIFRLSAILGAFGREDGSSTPID
jgi:uncharacterized protein with HEPN domain